MAMIPALTLELKLTAGRPYDFFYRHSGRAMNPVLHDHLLPDAYASHYAGKRDTPELETKAGATHRKRVPVAVSRERILNCID